MKVKLLEKKPISGSYDVKHFDVSAKRNVWVLFSSEEGSEWLGVFGVENEWFYSGAIQHPGHTTTAVVTVSGQCFVIDSNTKEVKYKLNSEEIHNVVVLPGTESVLAFDRDQITGIGVSEEFLVPVQLESGLSSFTPTIALDGIFIESMNRSGIQGWGWEGTYFQRFQVKPEPVHIVLGPETITEGLDDKMRILSQNPLNPDFEELKKYLLF